MTTHSTNFDHFETAKRFIPGGVNSSARAFKAVRATPRFIQKAQGAYLWDVENKTYIDYVLSWGPMILGHGHPEVIQKIKSQLELGMSYGAPTELETQLAQKVISLMPNIEKIRFVNSGTEATMVALRLARGVTKKSKIIKFEGCYHGHVDSLLVKPGSAALTLGIPGTAGVTENLAKDTLTAEFNNKNQITEIFKKYPNEIAGIILEPIAGNMNFIRPEPGFLDFLRAICDQYHSLLIFDEVMTGFRVALGGAQALYQIKPDLTCLGKVIGGGMPVAAVGGKKHIMDRLTPEGDIFQSGTLSGNPIGMAAGLATLEILSQPGYFQEITEKTHYFMHQLEQLANRYHQDLKTDYEGTMFGFYFIKEKPKNLREVSNANIEKFIEFFNFMLERGIYFACSAYEAGFLSSAHTQADIDKTLEKITTFFQQKNLEK